MPSPALKPDYVNGCPMCGKCHHRGTTIGFSRMNVSCHNKYDRLSMVRKNEVKARSESK